MTDSHLKIFISTLLGLGTCHIVACFQIYLSNSSLLERAQETEQNGAFHIPNLKALTHALDVNTIFLSAFFFTLTLGIGLCLLTLVYLYFRHQPRRFPKATTIAFAILWLALIGLANSSGFNVFGTVYLVLVPSSILLFDFFSAPGSFQTDRKADRWVRWGGLIFLLLLWTIQIRQETFTSLRDSLLLTHPFGEILTATYYRYTFYAASALESHGQPFNTLRLLIYLSALIALPILCYYLVYFVLRLLTSALIVYPRNSIVASLCCLFIGLVLLNRLWLVQTIQVDQGNLTRFLTSEHLDQRLAALKAIVRNNFEISQYGDVQKARSSTVSAERLWLAKALAASRSKTATSELTTLLNDPNSSVVCAALSSLGQRKEATALNLILSKLNSTPEWYLQKCAYQSLKALGWKP